MHPAGEGLVHVFESQYLALFKDLQSNATPDAPIRFGHILSTSAAPPALLEDSVAGLPSVGCVANVQSVKEMQDGSMIVEYRAVRRFKLLSLWQDEPYKVGCATWYDDDVCTKPEDEATLNALEADLYSALRQVAVLTKATSPDSTPRTTLPDALLRYAPPPMVEKSMATYLQQTGHPAGNKISTYLRHGSVYKGTQSDIKKKAQDPYQLTREALGKVQRRELFSFAAAAMLELRLPEQLALLQSRDTAARMQWTLEAVRPTLQRLQAHAALVKALGTGRQ